MRSLAASLLILLVLGGCTHAPPRLVQVFSQVNRVYDPATQGWSARLSVFVQASSNDGTKVFDRLHLIHDGQNLFFSLTQDQWATVEKSGEFWVGANDMRFPDQVPTGTWRVVLVTRSGQKVESTFEVPPTPLGVPGPRTGPVTVKADASGSGRYQVSGWVDDYLVWSRDPKGTLLGRTKTVGPAFTIAGGTKTFQLYSYDKNRGEGVVAGPFPVQDR